MIRVVILIHHEHDVERSDVRDQRMDWQTLLTLLLRRSERHAELKPVVSLDFVRLFPESDFVQVVLPTDVP